MIIWAQLLQAMSSLMSSGLRFLLFGRLLDSSCHEHRHRFLDEDVVCVCTVVVVLVVAGQTIVGPKGRTDQIRDVFLRVWSGDRIA